MKTKLVVALLVACVLTMTANAQPFSGKFTLPYEVHWGKTVLPAGDYSIRMDTVTLMASVYSAKDGNQLISALPSAGDGLKGGAFLFISSNEGRYTVRYFNLPMIGKVLVYAPLTKVEQEEIARGNSQATPVVVAAK